MCPCRMEDIEDATKMASLGFVREVLLELSFRHFEEMGSPGDAEIIAVLPG